MRSAHIVKLNYMRGAHIMRLVIDRTANLLGVVGLAIADRVEEAARDILSHAGETPAAVVVIGYGLGPSNELLRRILGLSHPGSVRLVDRLVSDGLVERRKGRDNRTIALYLTEAGQDLREDLLKGRLAAIRPLLLSLTAAEQELLASLLHKMLSSKVTLVVRALVSTLRLDRPITGCR